MKRSFDCLARCYEPLERLVFGSRLGDARRFCLPRIQWPDTLRLLDRRENVGGLEFAEVWRKVDAP